MQWRNAEMQPALVKWTVDLFAPGAIISPTLTKYFEQWDKFHSRRIIWPVKKLEAFLDIDRDGSKVLQDFAHVRVTSIMDGYDGVTDGPLDLLLIEKSLDEVFDLPRIVGIALMLAGTYQAGVAKAGWTDLYELKGVTAVFVSLFSITEIHKLMTEVHRE
jgi:hypothetical protein